VLLNIKEVKTVRKPKLASAGEEEEERREQ
jgi:hypothetical protein